MEKRSILDHVIENATAYGTRTAALAKVDGVYREVTWKQFLDRSHRIAQGLIDLGVAPGDRVAVMAATSLEWTICDVAILACGAVTVPIYPSSLAHDCAFIINDSGAKWVFSEDPAQTEKFMAERANCSNLQGVLQWTGEIPSGAEGWVKPLSEAEAEPDAKKLEALRGTLSEESILTIIYTSGTTGKPKGVVLTHDAMLYEAEAISRIDIIRDTDVQLFFLPLAHSFAKVLEISWLSTRHVLAFAESFQTIKENLGEVRPTLMCGVPRVFEKFYGAVAQKGLAGGGLKSKLFQRTLTLSQMKGEAEARGESLGMLDALQFAALQKLVLSKVSKGLGEILGGRMRLLVSGGAPLAPKIAWFFRDAGITVLEGYGLTETSAATFVNRPAKNKIGTVGPPMPGTEVRIADDGEILIKGRCVMREYWNNPEATEAALENGWFHTGDIGEVDVDGYLKITDRKKDIIVTAGGKNVAPQNIENLFKTEKLVSQFVVHGDQRKFLSALITLDPDVLKDFAEEQGIGGELSYAALTQHAQVKKEIDSVVERLNKQLASYETIKKYKILEQDFSVDTGELTPKLSVKRKVVIEKFKGVLDTFYQEAAA